MNVRQRVALLLAGLALVAVAGCTQPSAPGASIQPPASQGAAPSSDPGPGSPSLPGPSKGRGDY